MRSDRRALAVGLLLLACNRRPMGGDSDESDESTNSTETTGTPQDMGDPPQTEWSGILYASLNFGVLPSRFVECDTGLEFEIGNAEYPELPSFSGSCDGVFRRYRGTLDDSVDLPRIFVEEWLEARWCDPDECGGGCEPDYSSCYLEMEQTECDPVDGALPPCSDVRVCRPVPFSLGDVAGWMHHVCFSPEGDGTTGFPCEYPDAGAVTGSVDTCAHGYRCWNPEGTLDAGVCVPYCDMEGLEGPACDGECVQCSSSERGLCMTDCVGDECNVEDFC